MKTEQKMKTKDKDAESIGERVKILERARPPNMRDNISEGFAKGIIHDFNNLTTIMIANLRYLEETDLSSYQKELVGDVLTAAERAQRTMKSLLGPKGYRAQERSKIDLYDAVKEVFRPLDRTTNRLIRKEVQIEKGRFYIEVVPEDMYRILMNLAINSVEALTAKQLTAEDFIRISAEKYTQHNGAGSSEYSSEYVCITFEDSGGGIDDKVKESMFETGVTTKKRKGGSGWGLSIVKDMVVNRYKGQILVESERGVGTKIHLCLPLAKSSIDENYHTTQHILEGDETILVIDDEEGIRNAVKRGLERKGYGVITTNTGEAAIEMYERMGPSIDVVLLDTNLPDMRGERVLERLRQKNPSVIVIAHSGAEIPEEWEAEEISYVPKPSTCDEIAYTIRNLMHAGKK